MVPTQEGSVLYVYTKLKADSLIHSKLIRGPIIWKLGHVTPTYGSLYGPYAGRVRPLCRTKFQMDSLIHSKVIRIPKFRHWVT